MLEDSPSLKSETAGMVAVETARAIRYATQTLRRYGEATPNAVSKITGANYTEEQILGDWFPWDTVPPGSLPASGERKVENRLSAVAYPRCLLKKAVIGSYDALVCRFSLSI
jgi:hypothetical protein